MTSFGLVKEYSMDFAALPQVAVILIMQLKTVVANKKTEDV